MRWHLSGFITFLAILWPDPELMHIYCLFVCLLIFPSTLTFRHRCLLGWSGCVSIINNLKDSEADNHRFSFFFILTSLRFSYIFSTIQD